MHKYLIVLLLSIIISGCDNRRYYSARFNHDTITKEQLEKMSEFDRAIVKRTNPLRPRDFIPQEDGTVIDKKTGLQWMRCGIGQQWKGSTCKGETSKHTWPEAMKLSVTYANHSDWRLPTKSELETLIYCDIKEYYFINDCPQCGGQCDVAATVGEMFPNINTEWGYWSSSRDIDYEAPLDVGFFYKLGSDISNDSNRQNVRLVRRAQ